jgi:lactoylglutathione lyase
VTINTITFICAAGTRMRQPGSLRRCSAPPFPHYGLEHIGLTVDDVDAAVEELRAKGAEIAIGPLTRNPGLRLAFVRGPEGIMIELVQR